MKTNLSFNIKIEYIIVHNKKKSTKASHILQTLQERRTRRKFAYYITKRLQKHPKTLRTVNFTTSEVLLHATSCEQWARSTSHGHLSGHIWPRDTRRTTENEPSALATQVSKWVVKSPRSRNNRVNIHRANFGCPTWFQLPSVFCSLFRHIHVYSSSSLLFVFRVLSGLNLSAVLHCSGGREC